MSTHTVSATFSFKDSECKNKFIEFCNGDNGLGVTRSKKGCILIECYEKQDDPNTIIIWQKWESKEDHEDYVKFRHEDGSFEFLEELICSPPEISSLEHVDFTTDEDKIKKVIDDMCQVDYKRGFENMQDDCVFVRPTGNPLTKEDWKNMMNSDDVTIDSNELVSINKMKINGNMAFVCYTTHGKFNYKGTDNDDIAVLSVVLEKVDNSWTVLHGQRSTGRNPSEELPSFS